MGDLELRDKRKRSSNSREEEGVDAQNCSYGETTESTFHVMAECQPPKEERDVRDGEMQDVSEGGTKSSDAKDGRRKI